MSSPGQYDLADMSMLDLFRTEVENYTRVLDKGLIEVETDQSAENVEPLMRAAHSIKGAARIVGLDLVVALAHAMEDVLSAAQHGKLKLTASHIDLLLLGNDILVSLASLNASDIPSWLSKEREMVEGLSKTLREAQAGKVIPPSRNGCPRPSGTCVPDTQMSGTCVPEGQMSGTYVPDTQMSGTYVPDTQIQPAAQVEPDQNRAGSLKVELAVEEPVKPAVQPVSVPTVRPAEKTDESFVRVVTGNLNRLMGLAGECLVQANLTKPFSASLLSAKNMHMELASQLEQIFHSMQRRSTGKGIKERLEASLGDLDQIRNLLGRHIENFETFSRSLERLADHLYSEVQEIKMRPFSDGVIGFPRMVRDLARELGKKVEFRIKGESTRVDRDILEKLEAPLTHLLRNAVDHGIEMPEERLLASKPVEANLVLEARHSSGMLQVSVVDDGRGVDIEKIRAKVVREGRVSEEMASTLGSGELLDFLFLPGFSTSEKVTEVSGRGVGLDVVRTMAAEVGGSVRAESAPGAGTSFYLHLPLTLSVVRGLLVDIGGQPYAIPLARIDRILETGRDNLQVLEDKQFYTYENEHIGVVDAHQVLKATSSNENVPEVRIAVISDSLNRYGLVVDRFLGQKELVVIPLDSRLGKVPNVSAGTILEDGSPALILDIDDLVRSIDNLLTQGKLRRVGQTSENGEVTRKRVLVVDDSLTVREVERRLLENRGYEVVVAVDGMDGWNILQGDSRFDLVISDIDMPRMNGIEFIRKIRHDPGLKGLPVIIVSYKDREEDRMNGLEAGANYYLTKSSFHDEGLINAVRDMIGEPR